MSRRIGIIRDSKGLTLIEVFIGVVIGLIGALGGYALLGSFQGTIAGNRAVVAAQQEARMTVERMAREIRESSPQWVWPTYMDSEWSNYIIFYTPRDENREFILDSDGNPKWQRAIYYIVGWDSSLIRYQVQMSGTAEPSEIFSYSIVSKNIENMRFSRTDDMVTISVRAFVDRTGRVGSVAKAYADYYTTIKLRN